jgi:hypothetical protein
MITRSGAGRGTVAALALLLVGAGCSAGEVPAGGREVATATSPAVQVAAVTGDAGVTTVLAISIDGLNSAALRRLGREGAPTISRLMRQGAATFDARTERELTLTLPNHTGMVTGRRVDAARGGHGVSWNDDRTEPATVQEAAGHPVGSVFSVVARAGGNAALFASKTKFSLWDRSWPEGVDRETIRADNARLVGDLKDDLRAHKRTFRFLHLSLPDRVGHARGFLSRPYDDAIRRADTLVGRVVGLVERRRSLREHLAIVLTADHGGNRAGHYDPTVRANFRVPFVAWGPGVARGADLYDLNPDYAEPGRRRTTYATERQPVRNGAVANLALDLLGLHAIGGSEHDAAQDLDVD